ncbi:putative Fructose-1-phosphate kinase [Paratrimastix pyriformis]|uniref:Fructose-1-phosphate kinase n=1 Tax=Paratrimastix pyriformis TaxID=342808 RepID=A0ABQ8UNA9_9EUKA|nr:putative Fructose-1-phosphate kinase [Paratrimastix pyriformis]
MLKKVTCVEIESCLDRTLEVSNFEVGKISKAKILSESPAGKAVNVAHVLGQLGVPTKLYGFVGEDTIQLFKSHLSTVVECCLEVLPQRTRVNTTLIDKERHTETHIREQGYPVTLEVFRAHLERILATSQSGQWVVFSGSLPPGLPPEALGEAVRMCKQKGMLVAVDASGDALKAAVAETPDLIKPNKEELCTLVGKDLVNTLGIAEAASRIPYYNPGMRVLASDGPKGCYYITSHGRIHAKLDPETPVQLISTVGSGDALLAGFLCGLYEGWNVSQSLRYAVRVATATLPCVTPGEMDLNILYMDPLNSLSLAGGKMKDSVQQAVAHAVVLASQLIWSGYSVLAKNALVTFDSIIFAFFRLAGAMCILMATSFFLNKKNGTQWLPRKGDWATVWIYAFTGGFFNQLSYVLALRFLPASVVSMFGPLNPVCAMGFALILKKEKFSYLRLAAVILALFGAGIMLSIDQVILNSLDPTVVTEPMAWSTIFGYVCALCNVLNGGLLRSTQKAAMERLPLTMANAWMSLLGGLMMFGVSLFFWGNFTPLTIAPMAWVALAYAIVLASVVAYMLGSYSSRILTPTAYSLWGALAPFLTCTLAVIFLGESLTVRHWIGGFIVVLSLLLVIYARHVEKKGRAPETRVIDPLVGANAAPTPPPQSPVPVEGTELADLVAPTPTPAGAPVSPPVLPSVTLPEPPRARLTAPGAEETVVVSMVPHHGGVGGGGYQQTAAAEPPAASVAPSEQTPIVMVANPPAGMQQHPMAMMMPDDRAPASAPVAPQEMGDGENEGDRVPLRAAAH